MAWASKSEEINAGMRTASKKKRKKMQKKNDGITRKIIKELLAIEEEQAQAKRKFGGGGAQQRHSWSDVFASLTVKKPPMRSPMLRETTVSMAPTKNY
jgi:hypothetical protein